jgi:DNA-binding response OmpR family regulator
VSTTVTHVAVLRWPEEGELRSALRARRLPRLLLVAKGVTPPTDTDPLEDWASTAAEAAEVEARLAALEARATAASAEAPTIGDDDVIRYAGRWRALGATEARIARLLVEHAGSLVARTTIESEAWHGNPVRANTTDRQLHRLRGHLRELGLELHTIRGKGYVLDVPA